jgi:hypothetical protein
MQQVCETTCTAKTFNVLCFDFLRLHRNEVINYNNVPNKVIVILNDDWYNGSLVQNVIALGLAYSVSLGVTEDFSESHQYRLSCLFMVHLQSNSDRDVDLLGVYVHLR